MAFFQKKYYNLVLAVICVLLFIFILNWSHYLSVNKYITECFTNASSKTSHTVDLPLTTTYSCKNFCGPNSRCAITGQQCFTDIDCPGCQPYVPPLSKTSANSVPGNDGAGKLTWGMTPQYSPLTNGYGTHERIITKDMYSQPAMASFGINTWLRGFKKERDLYDTRYKPPQLPYMPNYPQRYSLTGDFIEDGPLASNAPL